LRYKTPALRYKTPGIHKSLRWFLQQRHPELLDELLELAALDSL
jgi:hypothetical protein